MGQGLLDRLGLSRLTEKKKKKKEAPPPPPPATDLSVQGAVRTLKEHKRKRKQLLDEI